MPPLHPVKGTVTFRGQPAVGFRVIFNPLTDIGKVKYSPAALTDATGTFEITSLKPGDGAPVGDYAITIQWPDHINEPTNPDPVPEVDKLRGAYNNPQRSKFRVSVLPGPNTLLPFALN
ncbi:hypothetical protein NA78x_006105 [Anatilimnocola sp. NA78]|uniref:hypothetical protein n=1 Tax=Anatilimnocola sp. NA78 TaxID=3415683 RepID=UPI003CE4C766